MAKKKPQRRFAMSGSPRPRPLVGSSQVCDDDESQKSQGNQFDREVAEFYKASTSSKPSSDATANQAAAENEEGKEDKERTANEEGKEDKKRTANEKGKQEKEPERKRQKNGTQIRLERNGPSQMADGSNAQGKWR